MTLPPPRNFLYFDETRVANYLTDLEGMDENKTVDKIEDSTGFSDNKVTKLGLSSDNTRFQKLYFRWFKEKLFTKFNPITLQDWQQVEVNQFVEITVTASIPMVMRIKGYTNEFLDWVSIMKVIDPTLPQIQYEKEVERYKPAIEKIAKKAEELGSPLILTSKGSTTFNFLALLDEENIRLPINRWRGEITVFARVQRIFKKGEKYPLLDVNDIFGDVPMNRKEKRKQNVVSKSAPDNSDKFIDVIIGPGAILAPVAIYD